MAVLDSPVGGDFSLVVQPSAGDAVDTNSSKLVVLEGVMSTVTRRYIVGLGAGTVIGGTISMRASAATEPSQLNGIYQVLATADLAASRAFYERYFGMQAVFTADWYVQLAHPGLMSLQLGLIAAGHPSMPTSEQRPNASAIVTMQVDDVDAIYSELREANVQLLGEPKDEPWGQRHFIAIDPGGFFVDVVMMIEAAADYAGSYIRKPQ